MDETGELRVRVPGDKSISQRALILAAMAEGVSHIRGILTAEDPRSTAGALQALGVEITPPDWARKGELRVRGMGFGSWRDPGRPLDLGNSGTGVRLLMGALASQPLSVDLTGDASLVRRPMERIAAPLRRMGATITYLGEQGVLPLRIGGGALKPLSYVSPVASAQIKSAVLLAAVGARVPVSVHEPLRSRDHSERMLTAMGVEVAERWREGQWVVEVRRPPEALTPLDATVPGDFSSAAFLLAWAALSDGAPLVVEAVGLNETRTGFLDVLTRMGARVSRQGETVVGGEAVGDIRAVGPGELRAVEVGGDRIPGLIDEIPLIAILAARARGVTRISGAAELRVKESDRLAAVAANLRAIGVQVEEREDGLDIEGTSGRLSGPIACHHDHRIAMAFGILGATPGCDLQIEDPGLAEVSFPGFWELLGQVRGAVGGLPRAPGNAPPERAGVVVTLDGPAGSGKSTTAREVASRLGFRHLDSGAIYRAVTLAILEAGYDIDDVIHMSDKEIEALEVRVEWQGDVMEIWMGERRLSDAELREGRVTALVSQVSGVPAVRARLLALQRSAATAPGLVADGRDMGTVVFPDAEAKFFLVADVKERARRRLVQNGVVDPPPGAIETEAARLTERDDRDRGRRVSPLRPAPDAHLVDTTAVSFEGQVAQIVERVGHGFGEGA